MYIVYIPCTNLEHTYTCALHFVIPVVFILTFAWKIVNQKDATWYSRRSAAGSARTKVTRCHKRKWVCLICHVPGVLYLTYIDINTCDLYIYNLFIYIERMRILKLQTLALRSPAST